MTLIRIDFETRSLCDLKATGAWLYSRHPTTEVLCYAWMIGDRPIEGAFVAPFLEFYDLEVINAYQFSLIKNPFFEAHNVGFELAIWENQMVPKYGWPVPDPQRFFCSAAKAAAHGLPRDLDGAAKAMRLGVDKDAEGERLMKKLSKPRSAWKKNRKGAIYFGTTQEFKRLLEYCKRDVETENALSKSLYDLISPERRFFLLDATINRRGVHCDRPLIKQAIQLDAVESQKGNEELNRLTNGQIQTTSQTEKIKNFLLEQYGHYLPNMQADTIETILSSDEIGGLPRKLLELRQRHSKSSVKKYLAMLNRSNIDDSRIRETMLYHGAHTGRWTGIKIQPHNYPRPELSRFEIENLVIPAIMDNRNDLLELYRGSVSAALSDTLRSSLTAAPGMKLIGADYSSIEARVLLWLAGEDEALEKLRRGKCLYIDMAATIYGIDPGECTKMSPGEVTSKQRRVGKETVLGAGYQMGDARFNRECLKKGITLEKGEPKRIINAFRNKYAKIKKLWYNVHNTALRALSEDTWTSLGRPLKFGRRGPFLFFKLPSGRFLAYKDPEIRTNQFGKPALSHMHVDDKHKWSRTITYGGALVENIVQAISRDIMAEAMLRAENAGYKIILSVHDELIAEVPKEFGSIEEFEQLLCVVPSWANGCPITAEGWNGERYRKG